MNYENIYNQIYPYCEIKSLSARDNGVKTPPRVVKIIEILNELNIPYTHESFISEKEEIPLYFTIYIAKSDSTLLFTAHHDIA